MGLWFKIIDFNQFYLFQHDPGALLRGTEMEREERERDCTQRASKNAGLVLVLVVLVFGFESRRRVALGSAAGNFWIWDIATGHLVGARAWRRDATCSVCDDLVNMFRLPCLRSCS